ncbi:MAG TPA: efflux RND transporter periplasmic adaptor subunit, partial [Isosphaeraceae bacterium]|nr:efflux RND transporter periplasmic adaptor subunit [Isosphaeraceae bacterium]
KRAEAAYQNARLVREEAEIAIAEYAQGKGALKRMTLTAESVTARAAIPLAQARLERTKHARQRVKDALAAKGAGVSPADILAELDLDDRIVAGEQALERAKLLLELAETKRTVFQKYTQPKMTTELKSQVEKAKSDELAKDAAWELEKSKETKLRRQIEKCVLRAPCDGVVVYANDPNRFDGSQRPQIEEGSMVRERQKIFSLPDISHLRVNTKVHESMIDKLSRGMRAKIVVDAFPNEILTGTVETIYPLPDQRTFVNSNFKVYTTLVTIENGLTGLRPGMTAQVDITVTELADVLSVPFDALVQYDGAYHVAVEKPDGAFEWRDVTLGAANDKLVEVKTGLKPGEHVALKPLTLMSDEEKVRKHLATPTPPVTKPATKKGQRARQ